MLFHDPVTTTYTTEAWPLGTVRVEEATYNTAAKRWIFVKNAEASTAFAAGNPVVRTATSQDYEGTLSAAAAYLPSRVLGFAQHAIAAGSYGWIQCYGPGTVRADASGVAEGTSFVLAAGTALRVDEATAGTNDYLIVGNGLAVMAANATGTAFINLPSALGA